MRIILKIIAAPFIVLLSLVVPILEFVFCYATIALNIISGIGVILAVIIFFTGPWYNGLIILGLAFLISPVGLPAIMEWFIEKLDDFNFSLKTFITS